MEHANLEYLDAKRSVDDRALSPRVRDRLLEELPSDPRMLEAGAGTGTMVPRLVRWGVREGTYRGVDRSGAVLEHARERRAAELDADRTAQGFQVEGLDVRFERGDALAAFAGARADVVVASAFLDLVPVGDALDAFEAAVRPGGVVYAPLTFDGGTIFQPDHPADTAIEAAYHAHIDDQLGRDSRAGRHVLDAMRERDGRVLSVASSDWIVRPVSGSYPADEATFLATILEFVAEAVRDHPEAGDWLRQRRQQLRAGELSYVAHQYDFLYRSPGP